MTGTIHEHGNQVLGPLGSQISGLATPSKLDPRPQNKTRSKEAMGPATHIPHALFICETNQLFGHVCGSQSEPYQAVWPVCRKPASDWRRRWPMLRLAKDQVLPFGTPDLGSTGRDPWAICTTPVRERSLLSKKLTGKASQQLTNKHQSIGPALARPRPSTN